MKQTAEVKHRRVPAGCRGRSAGNGAVLGRDCCCGGRGGGAGAVHGGRGGVRGGAVGEAGNRTPAGQWSSLTSVKPSRDTAQAQPLACVYASEGRCVFSDRCGRGNSRERPPWAAMSTRLASQNLHML